MYLALYGASRDQAVILKIKADKSSNEDRSKDPKKANSTGLYEPSGEDDGESGDQDADLGDIIILR